MGSYQDIYSIILALGSESGESESIIGSSAFPDPNLITGKSPTEHADKGRSSGCSYSCGADVVIGGLHP